MEPPQTIETDQTTVACDGGGGALGHPRVYLHLLAEGDEVPRIDCPYCGIRFRFVAATAAEPAPDASA